VEGKARWARWVRWVRWARQPVALRVLAVEAPGLVGVVVLAAFEGPPEYQGLEAEAACPLWAFATLN